MLVQRAGGFSSAGHALTRCTVVKMPTELSWDVVGDENLSFGAYCFSNSQIPATLAGCKGGQPFVS